MIRLRRRLQPYVFSGGSGQLMSKITRLQAGSRQRQRVNVYLDGEYSFSLTAEVALREGLHVGQELSSDHIAALSQADDLQKCLDAAARYLGYRPRSESELRQRLPGVELRRVTPEVEPGRWHGTRPQVEAEPPVGEAGGDG